MMSIGTETRETATLSLSRIHQGDCLELLRQVEDGTIDLVFADPPFNIGYDYDAYHDRHDDETYTAWCRDWITEIHRVLKPEGAFWLAIGDEYAAELKVAAQHQVGFFTRSWIVWYYTFGVNCKRKFSRSHVHLFHFVKDENRFTFNADDPLCRVPSARALVYGDKRANPAGRLPDDTWIVRPAADDNWVLRPQDLPEGFQPTDDTWYFSRVAGTFKERQGFHGCQMPEQLLGRIVRVSSNPDDIVLDPFAGSGTTLAVAKKLRRRWIGCELSEAYVRAATERLNSIKPGDALDGAADPIASAPSTANGRRLETFNPRESITDAEQSSADAERRLPPLPLGEGWGEGDSRSGPHPDPLPTNLRSVPGEAMATSHLAEKAPATPSVKRELRELVREAIVEAFFATHEGYSTDWLLANPQLQQAYHEACREAGLIGSPADWNRELLRLRKSGGFPKEGKLKRIHFCAADMD
ncbi:MAG: site-specific DNA-methyltransferase, partial [Planctomycetes bacterium]|nr:site-specific DNA-methyltransferase [Planctomycetota bacterium]